MPARPEFVIDGDGHICEPEIVWREYTRAKFRDRVLQIRTEKGQSHIYLEDHLHDVGGGGGPAQACIPGGMSPEGHSLTWANILPGSFDPKARLEVLDEEAIDQTLCFPSIYLLFGDIHDPEVAAETCRAYNDWISDFCKTEPGRLFGMGILPMQEISLALEEAKRIARLGLRGFAVRPERFNDLALYDERCNSLWEIARADDLAVAIHGSFGSKMKSFASDRYPGNLFYEHMIAHPFGQMAVVMDMIAGGVMDRYPTLRVGFFESGLGWVPYWLDRLDEHFEIMGQHTPWLKRPPSEIFASQCFVSMDADETKGLQWMNEKGLAHCILWGSDYPHFDATYPGAYSAAQKTFDEAGEELAAQIAAQNPRRYLGLA